MDVHLEPVEPADFREVHALLADPAVAETLGGTPADRLDEWRGRLAEVEPERCFRLKAIVDGRIAGIVSLELERALRRRHVARLWIGVGPAHRRRGVGSRLLAAVIDAADRWLALTRLELEVRVDNEPAIALYRKHGFAVEALRRGGDMIRGGSLADAYTMARLRPGFTPLPVPAVPPRERSPRPAQVRIRPVSIEDAEVIAAFQRDPEVMRGVLQPPFATAEMWRRRLENLDARQHHLLGAEVGGHLVGLGGLHGVANPRLVHMRELGMTVAGPMQGAGVGRALLAALVDLADRWLGLRRIDLTVYADNERAIRLYDAAGFHEEGRLAAFAFRDGGHADALVMGRVR